MWSTRLKELQIYLEFITKNYTQYSSRKSNRVKRIEKITNAELPKIAKEAGEALEAPISEEEIGKALSESALGKSPGPDGFTMSYYKKFKTILVPKLCQYMNGLGVEHKISRDALSAAITVILKEEKRRKRCVLATGQFHYSPLT